MAPPSGGDQSPPAHHIHLRSLPALLSLQFKPPRHPAEPWGQRACESLSPGSGSLCFWHRSAPARAPHDPHFSFSLRPSPSSLKTVASLMAQTTGETGSSSPPSPGVRGPSVEARALECSPCSAPRSIHTPARNYSTLLPSWKQVLHGAGELGARWNEGAMVLLLWGHCHVATTKCLGANQESWKTHG